MTKKLCPHLIIKVLAIVGFALAIIFAARPSNGASYLDNISVSPYAAVTHHNITDGESYGAGVDIGLGINKFVSLHALAIGYSDNDWRGNAVDEASLLCKARLVRNASETLSLYGIGGADRDFATADWAIGVGLGVELRLAKHVSLFGDSRVRAWFSERKEDLQTRAGINFSF